MIGAPYLTSIVAALAEPTSLAFVFFALLGGGILAAIVAGAILGAA